MIVNELLTLLGFKVDHKELDKGEKALEGIKDRLDFLAGAEILKGLFELGERFAKLGGQINVASQSAGITAEEFQKLTFAAQQSNVSADELESRMGLLAKKLHDAKNGSMEAQKAFSDIGVTSEQIHSFKNSEQALLAVSDRFNKIQDPIKKAALAQELMGRGSVHMIAFLSKGSEAIHKQGTEAERLGLILGEHDIEALEKLELSFNKFFGLLKSVGALIASYIAPVFSYMIDDFLKWFKINRDLIGTNIHGFLNAFAYGLGFVYGGVKLVVNALIELFQKMGMGNEVLSLLAKFAGLVTGILAVAKVVRILSIAWALLTSPVLLAAAAIAAVVVAIHDLYALMSGGQTWLGPLLKSVTGGGIGDHVENFKNAFTSFRDTPDGGGTSAYAAMSGFPAGVMGGSTSSVVGGSSEVNAPITINIPAGADPKEVSTKAKEGIMEHLDRVRRQTQRSTSSPVAY